MSSSALRATLKVVINLKGLSNEQICDIKNSDRACSVTAIACFNRHVTKSLINIFNLN